MAAQQEWGEIVRRDHPTPFPHAVLLGAISRPTWPAPPCSNTRPSPTLFRLLPSRHIHGRCNELPSPLGKHFRWWFHPLGHCEKVLAVRQSDEAHRQPHRQWHSSSAGGLPDRAQDWADSQNMARRRMFREATPRRTSSSGSRDATVWPLCSCLSEALDDGAEDQAVLVATLWQIRATSSPSELVVAVLRTLLHVWCTAACNEVGACRFWKAGDSGRRRHHSKMLARPLARPCPSGGR